MKTKILTITLAGAFLLATAIPAVTDARGNGGKAGGQGLQTQKGTMNQIRLHDGTATQTKAGEAQKKGSIYGPGDGTGNAGDRPVDGTGYGQSAAQTKEGESQQKGNIYGPGDGTGNAGDRPLDGTGYGAPANR